MEPMSDALYESHAGRLRVRPDKAGKSRITNGTSFLPGIDGSSPWVRRAKDLIHLHLSDLGGWDATSAGERAITRRVAVISVELENLEARFATNGSATPEDLALYITASNSLRRLLEAVGLQRRARDVTPDPLHYARNIEGEQLRHDPAVEEGTP